MSKTLVIVESPGKVKTIQKILGPSYIVKASFGHCIRIVPENGAIDIANNYTPKYEPIPEKTKVIKELKEAASKSDNILLAMDSDREGEKIAQLLFKYVLKSPKNVKRIAFTEITKTAILDAIKNQRDINEDLCDAQQARAVIDFLCGFKVSNVLFKKMSGKSLSAGRVQSVALEIIVDREKEIESFIPEEYWDITGKFKTASKQDFSANYISKDKLTNDKQVKGILEGIKKESSWNVDSVSKDTKTRSPFPPYNTSSLQQFASSFLGMNGKRVMGIAQSLYEGHSINGADPVGLITYMRTTSFNISKEALDAVTDTIKNTYGVNYLPPKARFYKSKDKAEVEAHECIRPTHLDYTPAMVGQCIPADEARLYEAIYNRFVACQMADAVFDTSKVMLKSVTKNHTFSANGQTMKFDGFLKVWSYATAKEELLPALKVKEIIALLEVLPKQHFTEPKPRYKSGTLTGVMEDKKIGRPSTYASIYDTLLKREYITEEKGGSVKPTEQGVKVCSFLLKEFPELMNIDYTARVEEQLDDVAEHKKIWYDTVDGFYKELEKRLKTAMAAPSLRISEETDIVCPRCNKYKLIKKSSRFGNFYGCAGYADKKACIATFKIGPDSQPIIAPVVEKVYLEGKKCDKCGKKIIARKAKKTGKDFYACSGFPACKRLFDADGNHVEMKKRTFKSKKKE